MVYETLEDRVYEGAAYIEVKDVFKRRDELKEERMCSSCVGDGLIDNETPCPDCCSDLIEGDYSEPRPGIATDWTEEQEAELERLESLCSELESCDYHETMIADGEFEDYAKQLAEDIGAIASDVGWPANCIDWEKAADELKADYQSVEYGDTTYWVRS